MRVLIAAHGHPRLSPGGGEHAAYAIHQALRQLPHVETCFLAAAEHHWFSEGQDLTSLGTDEWLMRQSSCGFFHPTTVSLHAHSQLADAVCAFSPEVIHLHHFFHLGLDLIHALRRWCPSVRIILTLHEFLVLCPYNGQLLKRDGRLCVGPNAMDCQECLPGRSAADLLVREQMVIKTLELVDELIAPSQILQHQVMAWVMQRQASLPPVHVLENLLPPAWNHVRSCDDPSSGAARHKVFGYFGQILPSKGVDLLLDAWQHLVRLDPDAHLVIHGRLPEFHGSDTNAFTRSIRRRLDQLGSRVSFTGRYQQQQVPDLMVAVDWVVMASRWLENSPVVIQEARACGRPLLVPDQGGMAEKVRHDVDGLHYKANSSLALSRLMWRCTQDPGLWDRLHASQSPPPDQVTLLQAHLDLYSGRASRMFAQPPVLMGFDEDSVPI